MRCKKAIGSGRGKMMGKGGTFLYIFSTSFIPTSVSLPLHSSFVSQFRLSIFSHFSVLGFSPFLAPDGFFPESNGFFGESERVRNDVGKE